MKTLPLAGLLLALIGCADKPHYYWEVNPQADFKPLKTYSFEKNDQLVLTAREQLLGIPMRSIIEQAIESQLSSKGFTKAAGGDFTVRYTFKIDQTGVDRDAGRSRADVRQTVAEGENPYVPMDSGASRGSSDSSRQGLLIVEMLDTKSGKGLWRGTFERAIGDKLSDEERKARLNKGVAELLGRFPPQ